MHSAILVFFHLDEEKFTHSRSPARITPTHLAKNQSAAVLSSIPPLNYPRQPDCSRRHHQVSSCQTSTRLTALAFSRRSRSRSGAARKPDNHRTRDVPAVMNRCRIIYQLTKSGSDEIGKLHFCNGTHADNSCPGCCAKDCRFCEHGVNNTVLTKMLEETFCDFERSAERSDVGSRPCEADRDGRTSAPPPSCSHADRSRDQR